ncbi:MAG: hypothetical protein RR922_04830 [Clostridia bacterium]
MKTIFKYFVDSMIYTGIALALIILQAYVIGSIFSFTLFNILISIGTLSAAFLIFNEDRKKYNEDKLYNKI